MKTKNTNKIEREKQRRRERKQREEFRRQLLKFRDDMLNGKPAPYSAMSKLPDIRPDFSVRVR